MLELACQNTWSLLFLANFSFSLQYLKLLFEEEPLKIRSTIA